MIDQDLLDYDFDEEGTGFGEPEQAPAIPKAPKRNLPEWIGLVSIWIGALSLLIQSTTGFLNDTWPGFLSAYGGLILGGSAYFVFSYGRTSAGIKHDGTWFQGALNRGLLGWIAGVGMTALYVGLYFYPTTIGYQPALWGSEGIVSPAVVTGGLVASVGPLARLAGNENSQWYLYGVLYTGSILLFGVRMFMKYRHNRYHLIRTASVMGFQTIFAWYLPNLLSKLNKPYIEFNGVWPLKKEYLWPEKVASEWAGSGFGTFLTVFAIAGVIATPILTYFYGKRWYCSFVCGCGGLAETLGDPYRQLSDKSTKAWKFERFSIHAVLVLVLITTALLWVDFGGSDNAYGSWSAKYKEWYGFYIGAVFSGVVGVGFYPLLGSRVWCRFGCPQAAILGLWQRLFSRFRITTNGGQCMSCGNCSTYCEMGIDVRAYAQRSENIVRASCVGCGVCAAVCPRGVLKLENGAPGDRYEGADNPLAELVASLKETDIHGYEAWK